MHRKTSQYSILVLTVLLFFEAGYAQKGSGQYLIVAESVLKRTGRSLKETCSYATDPVAHRILSEYGAVYAAEGEIIPPPKCIFPDEASVAAYQSSLSVASETIGGTEVKLQRTAMDDMLKAIAEARSSGLTITPRGGRIASMRSYADTAKLWISRVDPGLAFWKAKGKISQSDAALVGAMTPFEQVPKILAWEKQGIFFSTDKARTILSSVAAPGTSQHLSGMALDVTEFTDARIRKILAAHGWFQTVLSDTPHFTYLGLAESELEKRGLKKVRKEGYTFWVPNFQ